MDVLEEPSQLEALDGRLGDDGSAQERRRERVLGRLAGGRLDGASIEASRVDGKDAFEPRDPGLGEARRDEAVRQQRDGRRRLEDELEKVVPIVVVAAERQTPACTGGEVMDLHRAEILTLPSDTPRTGPGAAPFDTPFRIRKSPDRIP